MFKSLSLAKKIVGGVVVGITSIGVIGAANPAPPPTPVKASTSEVLSASTAKPKVETKTIIETEPVAFKSVEQNDANSLQGTRKITVVGVNGEKTITYQVILTDSKETKREKTGEAITKQPVDQVTTIGTKIAVAPAPAPAPIAKPSSNCDPNYSGCVPIASDVDCAGGSGNGPAYVVGPVHVIGSDIYGLDRDGNGVGCE